MHGRLKVRTSEEQKVLKHKEQQKKLAAYQAGIERILSSRKQDSYDPECFALSAQLLIANADIYTLWNYRKEVILIEKEACGQNSMEDEERIVNLLETELKLTEQSLLANPKSYSSWHHRYWTMMNHPKPRWDDEFKLCTKYLNLDDRNFHCWDYRRLLVNKIGVSLEDELKFSNDRLNENFSNYSSWHYRSTLRNLDENSIGYELKLVQNAIFTDPSDTSAWFYLRWVLSNPALTKEKKTQLMEALEQLEELEPNCKWILLTKCWLSGSLALNDKEYVDRRVQFYKRLLELDPMRKGQYDDYLKISEKNKQSADDQTESY